VLRRRNFSVFALAQMVSQFGDRLNNMALIGLIGAKAAGSTFAFTQIAVFAALPVIIVGPISGIIVDRFNRKWVLVVVDTIRTLVVALIPTLFFLTGNLLLVNLAIFTIFLLGLLFNSAKMSIVPNLVAGKQEYLSANAVANFIGRFATFLGLLLGGFVVEFFLWQRIGIEGWQAGFYVDAATYLFSAIFLATLSLPLRALKPKEFQEKNGSTKPLPTEEKSPFRKGFEDLKAAMALVRRRRLIRLVYGSILLTTLFLGAAYSLDIMLAQQVFGYGTKGVGILGSALGVGLIAGALASAKWGKRAGEMNMMAISLVSLGILMALSAFTSEFKLFLVLTVVAGFFLSGLMISQDTLFHRMVPASYRGRIFSAKEIIFGGGFMAFTVVLGSLGELLKLFMNYQTGLRSMLVACGGLIVVSVLVFYLRFRRSKRRG